MAVLRRVVDATKRRDLQRFRSLVDEQNAASTKLDGLLQGYGFKVCGSGENPDGLIDPPPARRARRFFGGNRKDLRRGPVSGA